MTLRFERAIGNGRSRAFDHPKDIVATRDLRRDQKIKLLQEWDYDLRLMMVASEENMPSATAASGEAAETLSVVQRCLSELGANAEGLGADPGATKTG